MIDENNPVCVIDAYALVFKYNSKRNGHLVNKYECIGFEDRKK